MEKIINLQNIKNSFQDILETQQLGDNECKLFQENIEKLDFYLRKFKLAGTKSSGNNKPNLELLKDIGYYLLGYLTNPVGEDFIEHIKHFKQDGLNIGGLIFEILYEHIKLQEEYDDKKNDLIDYIFYSSICYSLAGKEANSIFMAKKLEEYIDDDVLFFVISKTLQRKFKDIIFSIKIHDYSKNDGLINSIVKILYDNAYLFVNGVDNSSELINNLDGLLEIKKEIIETGDSQLLFIVSKIEESVNEMINNSVWKILLALDYSKDYILSLTNYGRNNIYELWEGQRKIIENIISQNENRILINMPTSGGKSLVAELQIINILQEDDSQKVIYVVPTNALANQVEDDLFSKFRVLGYKVSNTIDLGNDITELSENVIILTPEKLDLLIRKEPDFINQVSLIIFDEFHKIQDGDRGFLLETLMTFLMLKQDFGANFKILTISAIVDDLQNINTWFGSNNGLFQSTWTPTRKMYGILVPVIHNNHRGNEKNHIPHILDIKYNDKNFQIQNVINIEVDNTVIKPENIDTIFNFSNKLIEKDMYPLLIYFTNKNHLNSYVSNYNLEKYWSNIIINNDSQTIDELYNYIKLRLSEDHPLTTLVKYGIGIHNGDLPKDVRIEIEKAYKDGVIKLLLSTSTLAEGVNLGVKNLIFHNTHDLSLSDYRNVIGRVGRALSDTEGNIFFIKSDNELLNKSNEKLSILSSYDNIKINQQNYDFLDYVSTIENTLDEENKVNFNRMQVFIYSIYEYLKDESNEISLEEIQNYISGKTLYLSNKDEVKRKQFHLYNKSNYDEVIDMYDNHRNVLDILNKTGLSKTSFFKLRDLVGTLAENYDDNPLVFYSTNFIHILSQEDYNKILEIYEFQKVLYKNEFIDLDNYNILLDWMNGKSFIELRDTYFSEKYPDISKRTSKAVAYLSSMFEYVLPWAFSSLSIIIEGLFNFPDDVKNEFKILPLKIKHGVSTSDGIELVKAGIEYHELLVELEKLYLKEKEESEDSDFVGILDWILNYSFYELKNVLLILNNNTSYIKNIGKVKNRLREKSNILEENGFLEFDVRGTLNNEFRGYMYQITDKNKILFKRDYNNIYDVFAIMVKYGDGLLGYVPSEYSEELSGYLKNNNNLKVINLDKIGEKIVLKIIN